MNSRLFLSLLRRALIIGISAGITAVLASAIIFWVLFYRDASTEVAAWDPKKQLTTPEVVYYTQTTSGQLVKVDGPTQSSEELRPVPKKVADRLKAVEDRYLDEWWHQGVDPRGILRGAVRTALGRRQGGSGLAQQLAREVFLNKDRSWATKLRVLAYGIAITRHLGKDGVVFQYVNRVDFGVRNNRSVKGFFQAAKAYFGKDLENLSDGQLAILVGMMKGVGDYNPASPSPARREACRLRRNTVLDIWSDLGLLSRAEAANAKTEKVAALPNRIAGSYFLDQAQAEVGVVTGQANLAGFKVNLTINQKAQTILDQVVTTQMATMNANLNVGVVAMDAETGEILAMAGGKNYAQDFERDHLNRLNAQRQPGSVFKPIVFAAALKAKAVGLDTLVEDTPRSYEFDGASYAPDNFKDGYAGLIPARRVLYESRNSGTTAIAAKVGLTKVLEVASKLGLPANSLPSSILGATEATPLEVATAYTAFANGGKLVQPRLVASVTGPDGSSVPLDIPQPEQVLDEGVAFLVTSALADVPDKGTGKTIRTMGFKGPLAGKTGSSRDGWFAGYTPRKLLVVCYVGFDEPGKYSTGAITGGATAAKVVGAFLAALQKSGEFAKYFGGEFTPPPSVHRALCGAAEEWVLDGCIPSLELGGSNPTTVGTPLANPNAAMAPYDIVPGPLAKPRTEGTPAATPPVALPEKKPSDPYEIRTGPLAKPNPQPKATPKSTTPPGGDKWDIAPGPLARPRQP